MSKYFFYFEREITIVWLSTLVCQSAFYFFYKKYKCVYIGYKQNLLFILNVLKIKEKTLKIKVLKIIANNNHLLKICSRFIKRINH